jgi:hypothetical protein
MSSKKMEFLLKSSSFLKNTSDGPKGRFWGLKRAISNRKVVRKSEKASPGPKNLFLGMIILSISP